MVDELTMASLEAKKFFVQSINYALNSYRAAGYVESLGGCVGVQYEAYEVETPTGSYVNEFVVMEYRGGAIAAKNVSVNSLTIIMEDIATLMRGGYYSEVETYREHAKRAEKNEGVKKIV